MVSQTLSGARAYAVRCGYPLRVASKVTRSVYVLRSFVGEANS